MCRVSQKGAARLDLVKKENNDIPVWLTDSSQLRAADGKPRTRHHRDARRPRPLANLERPRGGDGDTCGAYAHESSQAAQAGPESRAARHGITDVRVGATGRLRTTLPFFFFI